MRPNAVCSRPGIQYCGSPPRRHHYKGTNVIMNWGTNCQLCALLNGTWHLVSGLISSPQYAGCWPGSSFNSNNSNNNSLTSKLKNGYRIHVVVLLSVSSKSPEARVSSTESTLQPQLWLSVGYSSCSLKMTQPAFLPLFQKVHYSCSHSHQLFRHSHQPSHGFRKLSSGLHWWDVRCDARIGNQMVVWQCRIIIISFVNTYQIVIGKIR